MTDLDLPPKATLIGNRYRLDEPLGAGAMGAVYRATDRLTEDRVALKRLHVPLATRSADSTSVDPAAESALRLALAEEFRVLASLHHPHIIRVLDYGFDAEQPYFTMDLLSGAKPLLEAGRAWPRARQIQMLFQLLQALAYLHRRGVLHRDLKPSNVLVTPPDQVKVLDFGLAAEVEQAGGLVGTLAYMAPEVVRHQTFDRTADLYAVGVMAYELLLGRYPFDERSPTRLLSSILYTTPDFSALGSDALAAVLRRWLDKNPDNRYRDAQTILMDLSEAVGQPPPSESPAILESVLRSAKFVGRAAELSQLTQSWQAAQSGHGAAWLIGGESGVGKSRLVDELRIRALVEGALVLYGRAEEGHSLPYYLWRAVLRRLLLSTPVTDLEADILRTIVPDIESLLERVITPAPELDSAARQERLPLTIVDLFRRQRQPIVLILEDLQWAEDSLDPLKHLSRMISNLPLLIVANYRDEETRDLPDKLPQMNRLLLARLDEEQIAELSAAMLGEGGRQPKVVEFLHRETEGNVFFLVETVRALAEEAGQIGKIAAMSLPAHVLAGGVQRLVRRRLARVPLADQPWLQLSAVAGGTLDLNLLRWLIPDADLATWLTTCANVAVLEAQDGQWRFAHNRLREALLDDLSDDQRRQYHRRVAEAIEAIYPDDGGYYTQLAEHWRIGGVAEKELHYNHLAGQRTLGRGAFEEGLRFANQLEILARELDNQRELAYALRMKAGIFSDWGQSETAKGYFERALALYRQLADREGIALMLIHLADLARVAGKLTEAEQFCANAYQIATAAGQQLAAMFALINLGRIAYEHGDYKRAAEWCEQALALAEQVTSRWLKSFALYHLGRAEQALEQRRQAAAHFRSALRIAQDIQAAPLIVYVAVGTAVVCQNDGQPEQAIRLLALIERSPKSNTETKQEAQRLLADLQAVCAPAVFAAAVAQGQALDLDTTVKALLAARVGDEE